MNEGMLAKEEQIITNETVKEAESIREKYKAGKASLDTRIVENEKFWKLLHWQVEQKDDENKEKIKDMKSTSAWLFNSIVNKHADAMDNYPELNVLPREESDRETAEVLKCMLPFVFEKRNFEQTYNDNWWNKLKAGTGVYGIFWDNDLEDGMGDIDIQRIDILNTFWEPGVMDIQKSRNLFIVKMQDADLVSEEYGIEVKGTGTASKVVTYAHDDFMDTSKKVAVIDWYYKKKVRTEDESGVVRSKTVLHYVKYCDGNVLFASENKPEYQERGWYDHGEYPVVFDPMFQEEGYPAGFGYIDIMKNPQTYIDKINNGIMNNVLWGVNPRYFVRRGAGFNKQQFCDTTEPMIEVDGNFDEDHLRKIEVPELNGNYINVLNNKIEELKETSGNRDFSQGSTSSGVTSGSAIAALMEAGSKTSRDTIKSAYRAHVKIGYFVIELMRQFYTEKRTFRVFTGNDYSFKTFSNEQLLEQSVTVGNTVIGMRKPVFDLKCVSQKASPFSKLSQNELTKELYGMGFFNPELADQAAVAIEMMEFEGKDLVQQKIQQNGLLFQQVQQLQMQLNQLMGMFGGMQQQMGIPPIPGQQQSTVQGDINSLGGEVNAHHAAQKAREEAASQAAVK